MLLYSKNAKYDSDVYQSHNSNISLSAAQIYLLMRLVVCRFQLWVFLREREAEPCTYSNHRLQGYGEIHNRWFYDVGFNHKYMSRQK